MSSRSSRKRPASGAIQARPAKRGRPAKADLDSQVPQGAISRATAKLMLANTEVSIERSNERQEYDDLISEKFDNWSDEDEKLVQAKWDRSEVKSLDFNQRTALLNTWKICLRLYRHAPVTIFSDCFTLRYQPYTKSGLASEILYSPNFCKALSKIMVHPCWQQDHDLLALGLRWTAICRIDDRRFWELPDTYDCPVLKALSKEINECRSESEHGELPSSYHDMHEELRHQALEDGQLPSFVSNLLQRIGEVANDEASFRPPSEDDDMEYDGYHVVPVTLWDLQVLSEAIDSTRFRDEWNYSTDEAMKAWSALNRSDQIASKDKLPLLYELSYKDLFRRRMVQEREELQSNTSSGSGSSGDDQVALPRQRRARQVVDDSDGESNEQVPTRTPLRNGPTLSQTMPQIPPAPASDSPSYQQLVSKVQQLESENGRLRAYAHGHKAANDALGAKIDKLDGKISGLSSEFDKKLDKMFGKLLQAIQGTNPEVDRLHCPGITLPPDTTDSALDSVVARTESRAASESVLEPVVSHELEPSPAVGLEPVQRPSRDQTPESETEVPETTEDPALPDVGPTPDPTLPVVDSTHNEDDAETITVSSNRGANAETRALDDQVTWTIPGLRGDSVRSVRTLSLPVRRFGSQVGNESVRNNRLHIVRRTLQAKTSTWLSDVCKDLK